MIRIALIGLILSTLVRPATAAQCIDYSDYPHLVAVLKTGYSNSITIAGDYAYVSDLDRGFTVVNISVLDSPRIAGRIDTPGSSWSFRSAVRYPHVYVAWGSDGVQVIDASDPTAPVIVGNIPTPGSTRDVVISGGYAFVAGMQAGLQVVDVSTPSSPQVVGYVDVGDDVSCVAMLGEHLLVGARQSGLHVICVADPLSPVIVGVEDTPGWPWKIVAARGHAYIADHDGGLQIMDISDPTSPTVVGTVELPENRFTFGVAVSGNYAYVTSEASGIQIVDIQDPAAPEVVGSVATLPGLKDVAHSGTHVFAAIAVQGLHVIEVSSLPFDPVVGSVDVPGRVVDLVVAGEHAFVADLDAGLQVIDVSHAGSPGIIGGVSLRRAGSIAESEGLICVGAEAGYGYSLAVIDASSPASPAPLGSVEFEEPVGAIEILGDYAYVVERSWGLRIVDLSSPASPVVVGGVNTMPPWAREGVAVSRSHAFVADYDGVLVVDVSLAANPVVVATIDIPGDIRNMTISGRHMYVAATSPHALYIVDVSDPTLPTMEASLDFWLAAMDVAVSGRHAYVLTAGAGATVQVVDVSNPASPLILGSVPAQGRHNLRVSGHYLYNGWWSDGLGILPIHCEGSVPVLLSGFAAEPRDRAVELSWFTSFESAHDGFHLYRSNSLELGYARLNDRLLSGRSPYSYLDSTVLPAATYYYKLGAIDSQGNEVLHPPTSATTPPLRSFRTALAPGSPNPFRRETTLAFTLAARQDATLAIYDVTGRLVRVVVRGEFPEGEHVATWDGRNDAGLRVAGGTYFVRFNAGGESRAEKVVFLGGR